MVQTEDVKLPLFSFEGFVRLLLMIILKIRFTRAAIRDKIEFMVEEDLGTFFRFGTELGSEISEEEWFQMGKFIHKLTKESQ